MSQGSSLWENRPGNLRSEEMNTWALCQIAEALHILTAIAREIRDQLTELLAALAETGAGTSDDERS